MPDQEKFEPVSMPPEIARMVMEGFKAVIDPETGEWVVGDEIDLEDEEPERAP